MRKALRSFTFIVFSLMLLTQSCDVVRNEFDITVVNSLESAVSVYLDDEYQFAVEAGDSVTIKDVERGEHTIQAAVLFWGSNKRSFYLDTDMEWTVDVKQVGIAYEISIYPT